MKKLLIVFLVLFINSCIRVNPADLIIHHANIYTVDKNILTATALAILDGKFIYVGDDAGVAKFRSEKTQMVDAEGKFLMPGFIDGHGHLSELGGGLMNLNFIKSKSWAEIVAMVEAKVKISKPGEWIIGRGWHQEKWTQPLFASVHGYPLHDALSAISPDNPVLLRHASGHGTFANKKAMELSGLSKETPDPKGGSIVRDDQGNPIGMFEETAQQIVGQAYNAYLNTRPPEELKRIWHQGIDLAQQECLKNGVTSFQDAGSTFQEMEWFKNLAEKDSLQIRLWSMLGVSSKEMSQGELDPYPWIGLSKDHLTVRSIKTYVDGALGSYGAWLLAPYNDREDKFYGQNTTPISEIIAVADLCMKHGLQLCVHAIGDRANREVLDIMQSQFNEHPGKKDHRWRIEHSQHIDTADIPRFGKMGVIASMQGIHCTSDAPFVVKRLGEFRAQTGAYVWRSLLNTGAVVTNGTDVPVEDVNPIECYYATVTRKRADNGMVFFPEQKMTREEGIYSYTMACAYSAFEENIKGSITNGKWADFILLSNDLIHCPDSSILGTRVLKTYIGGKELYSVK
ncbi:MAG: amidohydrolase family protein [Saprospiraceae bacterium]